MLKKVEIPPGAAAAFMAATAVNPRARRPKDEIFVKLPYGSAMAIAGQTRNALLAVLVELAHRRFKLHQNTVPLGNAALRAAGISHDAKLRALRQLEADGMVAVDWRGGKRTPHVTLLWAA